MANIFGVSVNNQLMFAKQLQMFGTVDASLRKRLVREYEEYVEMTDGCKKAVEDLQYFKTEGV